MALVSTVQRRQKPNIPKVIRVIDLTRPSYLAPNSSPMCLSENERNIEELFGTRRCYGCEAVARVVVEVQMSAQTASQQAFLVRS